jgi:anti-sigma B factor antagonist
MVSQPPDRNLLPTDDIDAGGSGPSYVTHGIESQKRDDGDLAVAEFRNDSTVSLYLRGELDMATRALVESALIRAEDSDAIVIELDFGGLTFMDSSGVHVAADARRRARDKGHTLVLLEGPEMVQRVFALTGTDDLFR